MGIQASRFGVDDVGGWAKVTWDFAVYGGEMRETDNPLLLPLVLPPNTVIWALKNGVIDIVSAITSAEDGASVSVGFNSQADWIFEGTTTPVPLGRKNFQTPTNQLTASETRLKMVITGEPLTGGKFNIFIPYYLR